MKNLNWNRIRRTFIQSAAGAGIALIAAIREGYSKEALISAAVTFVATVATAVLMNIQSQAKDEEDEK